MDFYEAIEKRRTVRDFEDKPIPMDIIKRILSAGLKAQPIIIFENGNL